MQQTVKQDHSDVVIIELIVTDLVTLGNINQGSVVPRGKIDQFFEKQELQI